MGGVGLWQGQLSEEELKRFPPFIKKYFFVRGSLYAVVSRYADQWNAFLDNLKTAGWRVFVHDVETDMSGSILPGYFNQDMDFSLFMYKEGATQLEAFQEVERSAEAVDIGFFKGIEIWEGQVYDEIIEPTLALRPPGGPSLWPYVAAGVAGLWLLSTVGKSFGAAYGKSAGERKRDTT